MNDNKQEINALKKDIQKLKSTKKKQTETADKCREKIISLQSELAAIEKSIEETGTELAQKEVQLKKAEYSSALQKLDDAVLSKFSKRQAELLAEQILSGTIVSLLNENEKKDTDNNINE